MIKRALILCIFAQFFMPEYMNGQSLEGKYMQQAFQNTLLYRGPAPLKIPFRYNGVFYAFGEVFSSESLWYNNKYYTNVLLNLDAYRDELYVKRSSNSSPLVLDKSLVEKFTLNHREFINIPENSGIKNLPAGFYQVVYSGKDKLFKKIRQEHLERPAEVDSRGIYHYFVTLQSYFLIKEGTAYQFKTSRYFGKLYKEKKSAIKKFIRTQPQNDSRELSDHLSKSVMQFIEGTL